MKPAQHLLDQLETARSEAQRRDVFGARIRLAEAHEACVIDLFRQAGWTCEPYGQGTFSADMRAALGNTKSPLRWHPDLLAVRGPLVVFADAKSEVNQTTPNYSLERSAYSSHLQYWVGTHGVALLYVWDDFKVNHIAQIRDGIATGRIRDGRWQGNGSGTPFLLVPKHLAHDFDSFVHSTERRLAAS